MYDEPLVHERELADGAAWPASTFGQSATVTQLRSTKQESDLGRDGEALPAAGREVRDARDARRRRRGASPRAIARPTRGAGIRTSRKIVSAKIVFVQKPSGRVPDAKSYGPVDLAVVAVHVDEAAGRQARLAGCRAGARRRPSRRTTPSRRGSRRLTRSRRPPPTGHGTSRRRGPPAGREKPTGAGRAREMPILTPPLGPGAARAAIGRRRARARSAAVSSPRSCRASAGRRGAASTRSERRGSGLRAAPSAGISAGPTSTTGVAILAANRRPRRSELAAARPSRTAPEADASPSSADDNAAGRLPMPAAARGPSGIRPRDSRARPGDPDPRPAARRSRTGRPASRLAENTIFWKRSASTRPEHEHVSSQPPGATSAIATRLTSL